VGGVRRRLARIDERRTAARPRKRSAAERRAYWEARKRISYNEHRPYSVFRARDFINHRRHIGWLSRYSAESLIDAILFGDPRLGTRGETTELSRPMVEATVYRAIYDAEPGLEHMASEQPPAWADAFRAADEWRDRLASMPVAEAARWRVERGALVERGATTDEIIEHTAKRMAPFSITEALMKRVMGPDVVELSPEEREWLIYAPVADTLSSEWAWQVVEHIRKLKQAKQIEGGE
jgi:hypothetical protein